MSLEIGTGTLAGLKQAAGVDHLDQLIDSVLTTATTGATEGSQGQVSSATKAAFAACLTLLFEAARHDAAPTDLQSVLEDASWPTSSITHFTTLFSQHKDALRHGSSASSTPLPSLVALASTAAPAVVDVHWRLDDYLKSDAADQVRLPTYLVSLTTAPPATALGSQPPSTVEVPFACNFQQLQDLLAKLKDAQKQIQQRVE